MKTFSEGGEKGVMGKKTEGGQGVVFDPLEEIEI